MSACLVRMKSGMAALAVILVAIVVASPAVAGSAAIPAGPTVVGVDGTTVHFPMNLTDNVLNFNNGEYLNLQGYNVVMNKYPRSFGVMTLGGPGYDDSVAQGVAGAVSYIKLAQDGDLSVPVKLVCLSQGADVCSQTNDELRGAGYDQSNVTYILLGNVDNADGGLKVRIPKVGDGLFVPGPGVTLGNATPTTGSDATIIQVSYEYDGFARAPEYPINVLADLNAMAGALLYHGNYRQADPYAPGNIVSTTPDGRITNIVIPAKEVPLLTLAKYVGLPQPVVDVINPTLKAVIDTGYSPIPEGPGAYPTEAVPFKLLPSATKFQADITSVQQGITESVDKLASSFAPAPAAQPAQDELSDLSDLSSSQTAIQKMAESEELGEEQQESSLMATGNKFEPTILDNGSNSSSVRLAGDALSAAQDVLNDVVQGTVKTITNAIGGRDKSSTASSSSTGSSDSSPEGSDSNP